MGGLSLDDVDLDSFVTEVESADVDAQVEADAEPDWDESAPADELVIEPLATVPVYEELPLPDLEPLDEAELLEEPGLPAGFEEEEPEAFGAAPEVGVALEPEADRPSRARTERSRRPTVIGAGVVLVAVVVVSFLIMRGSESGTDAAGSAADVAATGGAPVTAQPDAGDAGGPGAEDPASIDGASTETAQPVAAAGDTATEVATAGQIESLGESLLESVSRYYGLAVALDDGRATCADLQAAYIEVDDRWLAYNVQGKARFRGRLPDELAVRDERLYGGVQDVEREFTRSGCERP